ncbi:hypothetical protein [Dysgonomonas macrotermitis]|uniref:Uncharacterized protein n=1 Tax=Dysgonomonas macrotermitis TaxID=1346286 RepID=A0A1M5G632_9BACT|nr:hypothetical protein [Dysgonomonas macrotermitis]SHF99169.1 hypothetical protein SAMN05444362_11366 [Dysgonomonas macrotermitis]
MKKGIKYSLFGVGGIVALYCAIKFFWIMGHFAGSYPYTEYYEFNTKRDDLIKLVEWYKRDNPDHALKGEYFVGSREGNFYHTYFYFPDIDYSVHCHIRLNGDDTPAYLGFDGVSKGTNFGGWKDINTSDLTKEENKMFKRKFEEEILSKVGPFKKDESFFKWFNENF